MACARSTIATTTLLTLFASGCVSHAPTPAYSFLRPDVEKAYGYAHAVRIGDHIKISGAVSMDAKGELIAAGNLEQQMKNCYGDLAKVLSHYG
jgi:enamine deaminase RidA (YjgF/YER057c/UK114 family)